MHVLICFVFCFCCWLSFAAHAVEENKTINVYGISNLEITYGRMIVAAQRLAFEYINENETDLLPNYTLNLTLLDAEEDTTVALQHVFTIMDNLKNGQHQQIILPIVLGCPYSSLSSITAPALGAINWAQISSTATSISLSDTSRYPTFYRTIAADSLQSAGIIGLLEHFKWTKFAIIYVNDVYGIYLTIEIMRLASTHQTQDFEISPIAYTTADKESIESAVAQLRSSGIFITVLLVHDADISDLYTELNNQSRWGYPYFYIGVDAWFDDEMIKARNISRFTQGYLGTAPWGAHMLSYNDYMSSAPIQKVYNISNKQYQLFKQLWTDKYAKDADFLYNLASPSALSNYGWDSAFSIAYILQYILETNGTFGLHHLLTTPISAFNHILTKHISFIGITGNVSYKINGDRDKALFAYGNILENGSISWVGYFSDFYNKTYLHFDAIIWPKDFVENNMIPRSHILTTKSLITINNNLFITFTFFSCLSIIVVFVYMFLTFFYSKEKIMRAASWRLNIITCIGCVMAYIYIIILGLNEDNYSVQQLNTICAIRPWLLSISFTLVFMPLFFKTYRISIIFTKILKKMVLNDTLLVFAICICVLIDVLLLTIFTAVSAPQRLYENGPLKEIDALQEKQYIYAQCRSSDSTVNYAFFGVIGVYKLLQILFGIYCCLIVSRIGINEIRKFDETSTQLIAIVISISLFILSLIMIAFLHEYETNWLYSIQCIVILIICNVCLSFNLCPRFIAIFKGNVEKYKTTPEEEVNQYIQQQLEQLFKQNGGIISLESLKSSITERDSTFTNYNSLKTPSMHMDAINDNKEEEESHFD